MNPFSSRLRASALLRHQKVAFSAVALALVLHQTPLPAAAYSALPPSFVTIQKNTDSRSSPTAIIIVTPGSSGDVDNGECSLGEAIKNANNDNTSGSPDCAAGSGADTIQLPPNATFSYSSVFEPYGYTALPRIRDGDGLTIVGQNSTISRVGGSPNFRLMYVDPGASLTLEETTISGGSLPAAVGGGIVNYGSLTLTHSTISGNSANLGGGIFTAIDSTTTLTHSTISNNSAESGGGLFTQYGTTTLTHSRISGNSATTQGGGLFTFYGTTILTHSTISDNSALGGGGLSTFYGTTTLTHSTISNNSAGSGGGLFASYGPTTLTNSTISGNSANFGGGIFSSNVNITLLNSTLSGNSATNEGGGIRSTYGVINLLNSTVSGNSATEGGGLFTRYGTTTLTHTTISNNSAINGGGLSPTYGSLAMNRSVVSGNRATDLGDEIRNAYATINANNFNVLGDSSQNNYDAFSYFTPGGTDITATSDGTNPTALSSILGPLANNGGSTYTHALIEGGPAVDVTDSPGVPLVSTDQRGISRPTDDDEDSIPEYDAGAYEGAVAPAVPTPIFVSPGASGDTDDGLCSLVEAIHNANNDNTSGSIDCAPGSGADTIELPTSVLLSYSTAFGAYSDTALPTITDAAGLTIQGRNSTIQRTPGSPAFRLMMVDYSGNLTLNETTVSGGSTGSSGGGVYNSGTLALTNSTISGNSADGGGGGLRMGYTSTVTLTNSSISGNSANTGGGIAGSAADITLTNSTLSGNSAINEGGGIVSFNGVISLTNSTISGNSANFGGGVETLFGTTTVANSTISGNSVNSSGGGLYFYASTSSVINSTLSGNSANDGGGLISAYGTLTVTNSTISGNSVNSSGGGLYFRRSTASVTNSTISGNSTTYTNGGGLFSFLSTANVTNSTISGNSAGSGGGGVYSALAATTITHSTLSGNSATNGGGLFNNGVPVTLDRSVISGNHATNGEEIISFGAAIIANNFNVLGDNSNNNSTAFYGFTPGATDITATSDGTDPTPLAGILAPLGLNGGATLTHALVPNSPALDVTAIPDTLLPPSPTTDQRGMLRPTDGDGDTLLEYDAGSYESEVPLAVMLADFGAMPQSDHILVTWETAQETDNLGFNLYRSTDPAQQGERLNSELIPSQAPGGGGAFYTFPDANVNEGTTYYYTLESVSLTGQTAPHGPVSATFVSPTAIEIGAWRAENGENGAGMWVGVMAGLAAIAAWVRRRFQGN